MANENIEINRHIFNYLVNVTFFAGSDAQEDTDKGLYIIKSVKELSCTKMEDIFKYVNMKMNGLESEDDDNMPDTYPYADLGLNIDTLIDGISEETDLTVIKLNEYPNPPALLGRIE